MDNSLYYLELIFEEAVEKIIRIESFLKSANSISTKEERKLINSFQEELYKLRKEIYQPIQLFLSDQEELKNDIEFKQNVLKVFFSICNDIIGIQKELDSFVNFPKLPREIYSTVRSLFSEEQIKKMDPTILYTSTNVPGHSKIGKKYALEPMHTVLFIPYIDFNNPLMWSYLFHEMGHAIQRQEEESGVPRLVMEVIDYLKSKDVLTSDYSIENEQGDLLHNWINELISDRIAIKLIGHAFVNAFTIWQISWSFIQYPDYYSPSETHPHPYHRLLIMRDILENDYKSDKCRILFDEIISETDINQFDNLDQKIKIKHRCFKCKREHDVTIPPLPIKPKSDMKDNIFMNYFQDIILGIDKQINETEKNYLIPRMSNENLSLDIIRQLEEKLKKGIPIPSKRNKEDSYIYEEVLKLIQKRDSNHSINPDNLTKGFSNLVKGLEEKPTNIAEIFNAGWEVKCSKHLSVFEEIFKQDLERDKKFNDFSKYITIFDRLILKSIEISQIHKIWTEGE